VGNLLEKAERANYASTTSKHAVQAMNLLSGTAS